MNITQAFKASGYFSPDVARWIITDYNSTRTLWNESGNKKGKTQRPNTEFDLGKHAEGQQRYGEPETDKNGMSGGYTIDVDRHSTDPSTPPADRCDGTDLGIAVCPEKVANLMRDKGVLGFAYSSRSGNSVHISVRNARARVPARWVRQVAVHDTALLGIRFDAEPEIFPVKETKAGDKPVHRPCLIDGRGIYASLKDGVVRIESWEQLVVVADAITNSQPYNWATRAAFGTGLSALHNRHGGLYNELMQGISTGQRNDMFFKILCAAIRSLSMHNGIVDTEALTEICADKGLCDDPLQADEVQALIRSATSAEQGSQSVDAPADTSVALIGTGLVFVKQQYLNSTAVIARMGTNVTVDERSVESLSNTNTCRNWLAYSGINAIPMGKGANEAWSAFCADQLLHCETVDHRPAECQGVKDSLHALIAPLTVENDFNKVVSELDVIQTKKNGTPYRAAIFRCGDSFLYGFDLSILGDVVSRSARFGGNHSRALELAIETLGIQEMTYRSARQDGSPVTSTLWFITVPKANSWHYGRLDNDNPQ